MAKEVRTSRFGRLAQLGAMASGQAAKQIGTRTANNFRSQEDADTATLARNMEMADRLVEVLGTMRGAAQKFGQTLSMLDGGLIPAEHREEFQAKLAALQANAPKVPWSKMQAQIEAAVGGSIDEAFLRFDTTPVAAASIGQVYRAVHRDGRAVAVKVQYPGIERAVRADLKNMSMFLKVYAKFIHEGLDAKELAEELEARILEELDYELEADNTRQVAAAYRGHPFIRVPSVVGEYSDEHVLTTEWLDGRPLNTVFDADLETRNRVAEILFRFYSGTPYRLHMYSGDPHPGNSLVMEDGSIGFLDFGLFKRVSQEDADAELEGFRAAFEGDADRVLAIAHERGFVPDLAGTDKDELLRHTLTAGWWYFRDEVVDITTDRVNAVAARFADPRCAEYRFALRQNLPPEHAFRTRAEAQLSAIIGQLRPHINLHRVAREWAYGDEPITELGKLQREWDREVGHVDG